MNIEDIKKIAEGRVWTGEMAKDLKLVDELGTGWDYGKRNQWETDVFLGVLPKYQSSSPLITMVWQHPP